MSLSVYVTGLMTGLSLIVAIGAQNAFVLRQGLRRARVGAIVTVCILSDVALTLAGVAGIGAIVQHADWALQAVRWFGVAFLVWYGLSSAWRARRPSALAPAPDGNRGVAQPSLASTLRRILALTWLNPHVYLDTVILLGAISTRFAGEQASFGAGAMTGSFLFFFALGYGATALRPIFASPAAWRALEALVALTMWTIAFKLIMGL